MMVIVMKLAAEESCFQDVISPKSDTRVLMWMYRVFLGVGAVHILNLLSDENRHQNHLWVPWWIISSGVKTQANTVLTDSRWQKNDKTFCMW